MPGSHDARDRLLGATMALLKEGGIAAATPAAVAARAGAGKMSIYRHFPDKDALVAAALADDEPRHRAWLMAGGVAALFDSAAARADARGDAFTGCAWVGCRLAIDADHPASPLVAEHKRRMVADIAAELGETPDAEAAAQEVLLLYDGALVHSVIAGDGEPLRRAGRAAQTLLSARAATR